MSDPTVLPVVLVVEDEPLVRSVMADALQEEGFTVIEASNAAEALLMLEARPDISVVLTDVEMPQGVRGSHLAMEVSKRWPTIRVVVTSGRTWPHANEMPDSAVFLPKPWTSELLVQYVWEAADRAQVARGRWAQRQVGSAQQI
jgi:DNA-binding NtrC family response regulator